MAAWLIAAIGRIPPRMCRVVVVATAVLFLAAAITAVTLQARSRGGARPPTPTATAPSQLTSEGPMSRSVRAPVSAAEFQLAHRVAGRFLITYLRFAYGRASAGSLKGVTPGLRSQLITQRAQVTLAERGRHPRVVSLGVVGTTPGFVVATATIEDGGIAAYRLRFELREESGRWLVSDVQEG